jgi:hypothetical protein
LDGRALIVADGAARPPPRSCSSVCPRFVTAKSLVSILNLRADDAAWGLWHGALLELRDWGSIHGGMFAFERSRESAYL